MMTFQRGDLVIYDDPKVGDVICVILEDGCCGYGNDSRVIYVVHCLDRSGLYLVYQSELRKLDIEI